MVNLLCKTFQQITGKMFKANVILWTAFIICLYVSDVHSQNKSKSDPLDEKRHSVNYSQRPVSPHFRAISTPSPNETVKKPVKFTLRTHPTRRPVRVVTLPNKLNSTKIPGKLTPYPRKDNLTKLPVKKPPFTHRSNPTTRQVRIARSPRRSNSTVRHLKVTRSPINSTKQRRPVSPHYRGIHKPHKNHSGVAIKVGIPMNYRGASKLVSDNSSLTKVDKPAELDEKDDHETKRAHKRFQRTRAVVERIKNYTRSRRERRSKSAGCSIYSHSWLSYSVLIKHIVGWMLPILGAHYLLS
uniref:Uncharacterized protein n=1 Tax=Trichobilharzia regenti TaxID=157069 RepID=A0AA85JP53_TRIRE|nr:unnamed protein product [Trichobilharzia regenti]